MVATQNVAGASREMNCRRSIRGSQSQRRGQKNRRSGRRALVIDESGNLDQNVFDARRQKWIDEHIDASGNYSVMEGTPNAHGIDFTAAYPSGFDGKLIVHMPSARKMTMRMTMTMNGKTHTENETCIKK